MTKTSRQPRAAAADWCDEPADHGSACAGYLTDEFPEALVRIADLGGTVGP